MERTFIASFFIQDNKVDLKRFSNTLSEFRSAKKGDKAM
jgi:hypothetical protein